MTADYSILHGFGAHQHHPQLDITPTLTPVTWEEATQIPLPPSPKRLRREFVKISEEVTLIEDEKEEETFNFNEEEKHTHNQEEVNKMKHTSETCMKHEEDNVKITCHDEEEDKNENETHMKQQEEEIEKPSCALNEILLDQEGTGGACKLKNAFGYLMSNGRMNVPTLSKDSKGRFKKRARKVKFNTNINTCHDIREMLRDRKNTTNLISEGESVRGQAESDTKQGNSVHSSNLSSVISNLSKQEDITNHREFIESVDKDTNG